MAPGCPALTFQPRAYAWMISADRFICLYLFFCYGGERWGEPGGPAQGVRDGQGKHGRDPAFLTMWPRNQAEMMIWLLRISWYWVRHRQPRNIFWMRVASWATRSWRRLSRSKSWGQPG